MLNWMLSDTHDYVLLQSNYLAGPGKGAACVPYIWFLNSCLSDIHLTTSTWYTPYVRGFQAYFPLSGFLHCKVMSLHVTLSKQPADFLWGCMLEGKHCYTCGFFSLVSLCFWHIGHDWYLGYCGHLMLITVNYSVNNHHVVRSVLEEASLKMGIKSVLKT
jgi:hypothetical protein